MESKAVIENELNSARTELTSLHHKSLTAEISHSEKEIELREREAVMKEILASKDGALEKAMTDKEEDEAQVSPLLLRFGTRASLLALHFDVVA